MICLKTVSSCALRRNPLVNVGYVIQEGPFDQQNPRDHLEWYVAEERTETETRGHICLPEKGHPAEGPGAAPRYDQPPFLSTAP